MAKRSCHIRERKTGVRFRPPCCVEPPRRRRRLETASDGADHAARSRTTHRTAHRTASASPLPSAGARHREQGDLPRCGRLLPRAGRATGVRPIPGARDWSPADGRSSSRTGAVSAAMTSRRLSGAATPQGNTKGTPREHQRGQWRPLPVKRPRGICPISGLFVVGPGPRLPSFATPPFDGKEGVDGSSPSEGF